MEVRLLLLWNNANQYEGIEFLIIICYIFFILIMIMILRLIFHFPPKELIYGNKQVLVAKSFNYFRYFRCGQPDRSNPSCSRQRHRYHLVECEKFITQYLDIMNEGDPERQIVFAAEKLRQAVWHLGMISGLVATDEVLSVIFKQFCVGK